VWTPFPDRGGLAATLPALARETALEVFAGRGAVPEADLHLFHVDDTPDHAFVIEALRDRPGVVLLAEWHLHRVAREEALRRGGRAAYLREARRSHGEAGVFAARQHAHGRESAMLRSLFPLNDRALEASLGLVAFTRAIERRAVRRLPGRPVAHAPIDLAGAADPTDEAAAARGRLGISPDEALVVSVRPRDGGDDLERAQGVLTGVMGGARPVRVEWTHADDPAHRAFVAAADVVVALEHPVRGGLDPVVVAAMAAARPVLVTAGGAAALEFGEGAVIPVSPGRTETEEVHALVGRLLVDRALGARVGRIARACVEEQGNPEDLAATVLGVVKAVASGLEASIAAWHADRPGEGTLADLATEEVRWAARDLGLVGLGLDLAPVRDLFERSPR